MAGVHLLLNGQRLGERCGRSFAGRRSASERQPRTWVPRAAHPSRHQTSPTHGHPPAPTPALQAAPAAPDRGARGASGGASTGCWGSRSGYAGRAEYGPPAPLPLPPPPVPPHLPAACGAGRAERARRRPRTAPPATTAPARASALPLRPAARSAPGLGGGASSPCARRCGARGGPYLRVVQPQVQEIGVEQGLVADLIHGQLHGGQHSPTDLALLVLLGLAERHQAHDGDRRGGVGGQPGRPPGAAPRPAPARRRPAQAQKQQ